MIQWQKHCKKLMGFSIVGAIVTFVSILLVYIFNELLYFNQYFAYFLAYVLSLLLSYVLNVCCVWKVGTSWMKVCKYFGVYLSSMLLGMVLLRIFNWIFQGANHTLLSYSTIPFTMVWNYFFVNKVLTNK